MAAARGETTMSAEQREIAMRRILRNWYGPGLALAVLVAGCATQPATNVTFDYDTAANFDALRSFHWLPPAGNAAGDELLVKRIRTTLDTQLMDKGRVPSETDPDFLIGMQLSGKSTY